MFLIFNWTNFCDTTNTKTAKSPLISLTFMKIIKNILCYLVINSLLMATFSIVAVDTNTGEVGSAGGSCIAGSIIISDIHPGIGAIHTQSYYLPANQNYASTLMIVKDQSLMISH